VLDLGAGTGKLTQVLADRYAHVIAVEPVDELRAILAERVPAADALAASAESIPLGDASVDGVFAGQAFHWFANDAALGEISRVLRPGGTLAVMWNESEGDSPLPDAYRSRLDELRGERPVEPIDWDILRRFPFGELHEAAVGHEQVSSREDTLAFAASVSWIASRDDREEVLSELGALLPPGDYVFPMRTEVTWAIRRSG
jgi:SAM-dependent methyltransferase